MRLAARRLGAEVNEQYFREQILNQMQTYSCLDESEYKHGLYDALDEIIY